jgi:hypothetical protein
MQISTESGKAGELTLTRTVAGLLGHYLGGRRGIILLAVAAAGAGLYLGWGWLAAVGIAPVLLALVPCAAMCALGLCMNKGGGKSCSTDSKPSEQTTTGAANQDEGR